MCGVLLLIALEAWGQDYGENIYADNRHAVVTVVTFEASGSFKGLGTGFFTASTGEVVTNFHVVEGASALMIKQLTGALFPVEGWLAFSQEQDFAVLKVNGKELPTVKLGALETVAVGQRVFALGSPLGMEQTFTDGMVSSIRDGEELDRPKLQKVIQHTAPISPGNSGSPLFNSKGEVIGINTLFLRGGQNLNFAIPIDYIKPHLGKTETNPLPVFNRTDLDFLPTTAGRKIVGKDGAPMVLIPAGEFQMGDPFNEGNDNERPAHTVYLDAFYMDKYEVTNAQFKKFIDANPAWSKGRIRSEYHFGLYLNDWNGNDYPAGEADHPVVYVSWYAAMAYAQ